MRKLKLQIQVSIDGFVSGLNGEMDWMVWNWDEVIKKYTRDLTESVDTIVMGRVLAQGMSGYWPAVAQNPESSNEDKYAAEKMNSLPKVVFSKTITSIDWTNVTISADDISEVLSILKQQKGKDIIMYGGATIVSSFIKLNLIDEYHIYVNPSILGKGMPIFQEVEDRQKLNLIKATVGESGIVILHYEPARD